MAVSSAACAPGGMPLRRTLPALQEKQVASAIVEMKKRMRVIKCRWVQSGGPTFQTSIQAVGSFGNESVISVSLGNSGARSRKAVSAVIFARYGLFARCDRWARTM